MAELTKEKIELEYEKLNAQKENAQRDHEIELRKLDLEKEKMELEKEKVSREDKKLKHEIFMKVLSVVLALVANMVLAVIILTFEHWYPTKLFNWVKPVCM